jgi:hypothetical protein
LTYLFLPLKFFAQGKHLSIVDFETLSLRGRVNPDRGMLRIYLLPFGRRCRKSTMRGFNMGLPVVHFEIIGTSPDTLRDYYGGLFQWEFNTGDAISEKVSQPGMYHFVDGAKTGAGNGINGGVGGGDSFEPGVLFYVGVPDVEAALSKAESLGGKRLLGPEPKSGDFTVGRFADPEGNVIGVAGPSS